MTLPSSFRTGLRRSLLAVAVGTVVSGMTFSSAAVAQERELLNSSYDIATVAPLPRRAPLCRAYVRT